MDAVGRAFEGKRVFVTGHTGFKGSWLCEWLLMLGAKVSGYSLPPPTKPALYDYPVINPTVGFEEEPLRCQTGEGKGEMDHCEGFCQAMGRVGNSPCSTALTG